MPPTNDSEALRSILNRRSSGPAPSFVRAPTPAPTDVEEDDAGVDETAAKDVGVRAANKNLTRLHIVDRAGRVRTFQYQFLDVESTFDGGSFTLIFVGERKHWQIMVKGYGPKFWSIYDYISLHRLPYLREATGSMPDLHGNGEAVITAITITDVTPK